MALNVTPIRTAIEELLEGTIGTTRTVSSGTFTKGAHSGRSDGAQRALATVSTKYEVQFPAFRLHEATPISRNGSKRLEELDVAIMFRYDFSSEVLEGQRSTVIDSVLNDGDTAVQALFYAQNLLETNASVATNLVSGMLVGPHEFEVDEDWDRQMCIGRLTGKAIVNVSQAVS